MTLDKFDEIENTLVRTYNRVVFMNNLMEDAGQVAVQEYIELLEDWERKQIFILNSVIMDKGLDYVQALVRKEVQ